MLNNITKITLVALIMILFIIKLLLSTNISLDMVRFDITHNDNPFHISVCTYNIQSLPNMTKQYGSISKMLSQYDIVILQEAFNSVVDIGNRDRLVKDLYREGFLDVISAPEPDFFSMKFTNGGLLIISKYQIEYIKFIPFTTSVYSDSLSNKGILVGRVKGIYIINTHLQAIYDKATEEIVWDQLLILNSYIKTLPSDAKVISGGDFNINLLNGYNRAKFNKLFKSFSVDDNTEITYEESGEKFDCLMSRGINGSNYKINKFNNYSDHYGLSGVFQLM